MLNKRVRFVSAVSGLVACLLLLAGHLLYLLLNNPTYFPVNTVKISANYHHISRSQLEAILSEHLDRGFFGVSTQTLKTDLMALAWSHAVDVTREWPDILAITVVEKVPCAVWNDQLMTAEGEIFFPEGDASGWENLPHLKGNDLSRDEIYHQYQTLNQVIKPYRLQIAQLTLRENRAWELTLANGLSLRLGKQDIEARLRRFGRAYPVLFAGKSEQSARIDLRYAHGMAIQWGSQSQIVYNEGEMN